MLRAVIFTLTSSLMCAQFKATVPLVIAPTTVRDSKGRFIDLITEHELVFYDNGVRQAIQINTIYHPISLVVVIQASSSSAAILDKLGGSGILFSELIAAEGGETAIVLFSNSAKVVQPFTSDSGRSSHALRGLRVQGDGCAVLDGLLEALHLLSTREASRRRIVLVVAERRDRSSKLKLPEFLRESQLQNTTVYWITYSTFLVPFTNRPKSVWDKMSDEEKADPRRMQPGRIKYPWPDEENLALPDVQTGSLFNIFTEMSHRGAVDIANLISRATGGRALTVLSQAGLEHAIQVAGEEVHHQYMVSFQPEIDKPGRFHAIGAEVGGKPDLKVQTRGGYWHVE